VTLKERWLAVLVAAIWGYNFVPARYGIAQFPPLLFAALRFAVVALPAVFFIKRPKVAWRSIIGVGMFMGVGQFGSLYVSMHNGMPAGLASIVMQMQALWTVLFAVSFLGEHLERRHIIGMVVAFAGLGVIAANRAKATPWSALGLCIFASVCWACSNITTRKARSTEPFALVIWASAVAPIPLLVLSFLVDGGAKISASFQNVPFKAVYGVLFAGFVGTIGAYGLWSKLLASRPASEVAPYSLLVPFFGISSAWLFLNERPAVAELIGAAVMILGVAIVSGLRFPSRFVSSTNHGNPLSTELLRGPVVDDVDALLVGVPAD
jgi:O-acetylserine/cysteine efflux transporter